MRKIEELKQEFAVKWGCRTIPSHDFTDDKYEDKSQDCLFDLNTLLNRVVNERMQSNMFRADMYQDTEADGYVYCGKCGALKT
jgi:hypothetical protein